MSPALQPADIVRSGLCIGCGSCVARSGAPNARMGMDCDGLLKPVELPSTAAPPGFARTCPFSPAAADEDRIAAEVFPDAPRRAQTVGRYRAAYVGHVAEQDFRRRGSSGGLVSWVATELLRRGVVDGVAHVVASDEPQADVQEEPRFFRYRIARTEHDIRAGAQSRYYPVEMSEVLRAMRAQPGRYAVVGVPCFIKAVQLLRREDPVLRERIACTLGLFCGHMKSARFVDSLALQSGVPMDQVRAVDFRHKSEDRPANWYHARLALRDGRVVGRDWWHLADGDWGAGYFMASACNFCDDVVAETADVSFGDAWVEPYASDWQGTNVMLVRSPQVAQLVDAAIEEGRLQLEPVDDAFVARTQAAGLRQRREGLAYRLSHRRTGVMPRKRVFPAGHPQREPATRNDLVEPAESGFAAAMSAMDEPPPPPELGQVGLGALRPPSPRRRLVYATRRAISAWSHRVFRWSRAARRPGLYLRWARAAAAVYHALAYYRGRLGTMVRRLGL